MISAAPHYDADFYSDDFIRDPHPHYTAMRALGPVVYLPKLDNYALTRYAEVQNALRDHARFTSAQGVAGDKFGSDHLLGNTVASDPPRHTTLRRAMAPPLLPGAIADIQPEVERVAASLIDGLLEQRDFDAIEDLSRHLPLKIVTEMVGLPDFGQDNMLKWAAAAFDVLGAQNARGKKGLEAINEMREFISGKVTFDTLKPGSWTHRVLQLVENEQLDADLAPFAIRDYINPSLDTTISATGQLIWQLANNPDQWDRLRSDPELCRNAVNEAVRLGTPIRSFTRQTTEPVNIAGVEIPASARVMMLFASANRDERIFSNPDQYDINRNPTDHLGFGSGIHMCVGMHLAQLEMISLLRAMIPRVDKITVGTPEIAMNNTIAAYASLPTTFIADRRIQQISLSPTHTVNTKTTLLDAEIIAREIVATDIVSLSLRSSNQTPLPVTTAGAHIDIHLREGMVRQYSLTGRMSDTYQIAVQKEPESRGGSITVHDRLNVGARIKIGSPRNFFPLTVEADHNILFSGGIGLTPILAMAWELHDAERSFTWHLSARSEDRIAYRHSLSTLPFNQNIQIYTDDKPDKMLNASSILNAAKKESHIYVCGPNGYMQHITNTAAKYGFSGEQVHTEFFGAEIDTDGETFEVYTKRTGHRITVGTQESILDALTRVGIEVPTSCQNGVCGSCLTRVINGKPDHRDLVMTDIEKARNDRIAVCCSRSQSKRLELDI